MFKDFIKETAGIQWYPIVSLLVFVLFFTGLLVQTFFVKKDFSAAMSMLPLHDETIETDPTSQSQNE